ncbi:MAG: phosphoethanolamine--lipid A transferase [Sulfurovaceae bacterium]|nr:phosphoethanolamine--lipid A transferase [Sulfurovaceae bacterium]
MKFTQNRLIFITSLFFVFFYNLSFFSNTLKVYPLAFSNVGFLISLAVTLWAAIVFILELFSYKKTIKPLLIFLLFASSFAAYFMDTYGVIIDDGMLINAVQTNVNESLGLLSFKLILYILFLGVLPSIFIYKVKINYQSVKKELISKMIAIFIALCVIGLSVFAFSGYYASFFREHKPLRQHTNPTFWVYSVGKLTGSLLKNQNKEVVKIGLDAKIENNPRKKVVIMVVGEAARWDHFSLNGYSRETNPMLKKEDIVNLPNVYSCGTSTAYSVPCMFSIKTRKEFDIDDAPYEENVLDVLKHTGKVAIIWRDNNSDSKKVADRVIEQDYRTSKNNTICDSECRDDGMLVGLDKFIEQNKDKDILIVLHQMGNHGPEYYKRYTKDFEKFTPTCKTNQLESCKNEEIVNAYDNVILYTDSFLSKTINFLKKYDTNYDTSMIYMSDHGESLGENGVYLHGMPYMIAPEAQKHVGAVLWFGDSTKKTIPYQKIVQNANKEYSQDNLFHTLLGLFAVKSSVYDKSKDMINENK